MLAKSHVVIGLAAWLAAAPELHLAPLAPLELGLAIAGSLLPDIDHPNSWIGRRSRPVSTFVAGALGHRGITHSALAVLGLTALLIHADQQRAAISALAVGYLSHLGADMLTPRGLRLAWPLRQSWGLPLCRTGSAAEPLVVSALICGIAWWIVAYGRHPG